MDLGLAGLKALVTGGTKGIGRAIVDQFAAEGTHVALCARTAAEVDETVAATRAKGVEATGRPIDVSDGPALKAWVADAATTLGGLDIIVANVSALAIDSDEASWLAQFNTDLMGTVRAIEAAMPFLERSKAPSVVIISSVSGREIDFAAGPYGVIKAALIHYAKGLAFQLAAKGIRVNTVSPGNTYFPGGVWEKIETGNPSAVPTSACPQSDRPYGSAGRSRARRRVPRKPGCKLYHGNEPTCGRRADPRCPVLNKGAARHWLMLDQPPTPPRRRTGCRRYTRARHR